MTSSREDIVEELLLAFDLARQDWRTRHRFRIFRDPKWYRDGVAAIQRLVDEHGRELRHARQDVLALVAAAEKQTAARN